MDPSSVAGISAVSLRPRAYRPSPRRQERARVRWAFCLLERYAQRRQFADGATLRDAV